VNPCNDDADSQKILHNHAAKQRNCQNVVHTHLPKILASLLEDQVVNQVVKVEAQKDQGELKNEGYLLLVRNIINDCFQPARAT